MNSKNTLSTTTIGVLLKAVLVILALTLQDLPLCTGLAAKDFFFMDQRADCYAAGTQSVARGQNVVIYGRSNTPGPRLECRLLFEPERNGDTLEVTFGQQAHFADSSVELVVSLSNKGGSYTYGSLSTQRPPVLESVDGTVTIYLKKGSVNADFMFQITVTAKETIDPNPKGDSGTADIGLIAGLVIGFLVLIVIIAVIAIFLVRKRRDNVDEPKREDVTDGRSRSRSFNRVERLEKDEDHGSSSNLSLSYDKRSIQF